jgi:hypothetical protein
VPTLIGLVRIVVVMLLTFISVPIVRAESEGTTAEQTLTLSSEIEGRIEQLKAHRATRRLSPWLYVALLLMVACLPYSTIRV